MHSLPYPVHMSDSKHKDNSTTTAAQHRNQNISSFLVGIWLRTREIGEVIVLQSILLEIMHRLHPAPQTVTQGGCLVILSTHSLLCPPPPFCNLLPGKRGGGGGDETASALCPVHSAPTASYHPARYSQGRTQLVT